MVTEYLISELAQHSHYAFMQTFPVEMVQVELWSIAWKQCTVICNLQTSLFQLLSNILAYKNHHVYICAKYIYAKFYQLSLKHLQQFSQWVSGHSIIWCFLTNPPPPPFQERHENFLSLILFHGMQIDSFAFFLLASIIVQLESALNSLYSHTRKSIHYIFCVSHS